MDKKEQQRIPMRNKVAYEIAVLDRIEDIGRQRVISPSVGFINAVKSLEGILFPNEREELDKYKYDLSPHTEELIKAKEKVKDVQNIKIRTEVYLNEIKGFSWILYRSELEKCLNDGTLPDTDFNNMIEQKDVRIMAYEALEQKLIEILKKYDWLVKGDFRNIGGGGIGFEKELGILYDED